MSVHYCLDRKKSKLDLTNTERELKAQKHNNKTRGHQSLQTEKSMPFRYSTGSFIDPHTTNTSFFLTETLNTQSEFQRDLKVGSIDLLYEQFDGL